MNTLEQLKIRSDMERIDRQLIRHKKEKLIMEINKFVDEGNVLIDKSFIRTVTKKGEIVEKTARVTNVNKNGYTKHIIIPKIYCDAVGVKAGQEARFRVFEGKLIIIIG